MIGNWYDQMNNGHVCQTTPHPMWILQQCPRCEGHGSTERRFALGVEECTFCFGVGVVKVGWWDGKAEPAEPTREPQWHVEKRASAGAEGASSSLGGGEG